MVHLSQFEATVERDVLQAIRTSIRPVKGMHARTVSRTMFLEEMRGIIVDKTINQTIREIRLLQIYSLIAHFLGLLHTRNLEPLKTYLKKIDRAQRRLDAISDNLDREVASIKTRLKIRKLVGGELLKYYSIDSKNAGVYDLLFLLLDLRLRTDLGMTKKQAKNSSVKIAKVFGLPSASAETVQKRLFRLQLREKQEYESPDLKSLSWPDILEMERDVSRFLRKRNAKKVFRSIFSPHPNINGCLIRGRKHSGEESALDNLADILDRRNKRYGLKPFLISKILCHFACNNEGELNGLLDDQAFCSAVASCHS